MYTSAILAPTSEADSLILPDDVEPSFPVSGTYGENLRDDSRTFLEAAIEDEKQIVRVMAVPQEFYEFDYFICASRQDAAETSTMVCAAPCDWSDEELQLTFHVDVTVIDPAGGESSKTASYNFPVSVKRFGNLQTKTYSIDRDTSALEGDTITLIKTPLTTYAFYGNGSERTSAPADLLDASGAPFAPGVPTDSMTTLELTKFPPQVSVCTEQGKMISFCAEKEGAASEE